MAELVYAYGSEPYGVILGGSNPLVPTVFFSGRSIPVVRILREDVDRVQFSTARHCDTLIKVIKLFLSVAGDRTHIGTYVGVSPPPASNEKNKIKSRRNFIFATFYFLKYFSSLSVLNFLIFLEKRKLGVIHSFVEKVLYYVSICEIIKVVLSNKYFGRFIAN